MTTTRLVGAALFSLLLSGWVFGFDVSPLSEVSPIQEDQLDKALASSLAGVRRDGAKLIISTKNEPVEFKDSESGKYRLVGFFQQSMKRMDYFVFQGYSERHSYFIVNGESGSKVRLQGLPQVSPDGLHYLMVSMDLEAASVQNLVQVVRTSDFSTEFEKYYPQDDGIGPSRGSWIDSSRIFYLERGMQRVPAKPMTIELKKGKWIGPRELK